jgi:GT2 family glycosyltransferase
MQHPSESAIDLKPATGSVPDMSIVLVCWNDSRYLDPCLQSLRDSGLRCSYDVVVVDNGSSDGSQAMLFSKYPEVMLLQNDHNVGLGRASNQGIQATSGRYILLLNNDTLVNSPSLDAMVEFLDTHPEAGAAGGRLLNPDGSFQAGGSAFPSLGEEFLIATRLAEWLQRGKPSPGPEGKVRRADWLGSACLLLRRAALDEVGLLDEDYFIYGDETDLQYRFRKAGWAVYFLPNVHTIHYGGRSMDRWRRRKMVYRGKMLFYRKNYGPVRTGALRLMLGILSLGKMLFWAASFPLPRKRQRIGNELRSNLDVIKLCWKLT